MSSAEEKYTKRKLRASYITTVVSISLVLFLLGLLGMLIFSAKSLSDYVKENIGISIMIKENVKEAEVIRFQKMLDASSFVKTTEFISKDKAAEILKEELGEDFINFFEYNPLPLSIDIHLNSEYTNNDSLSIIESEIRANPIVKEVAYQKDLISIVNSNVRKISIGIMFFSALLLLIAIALINNTIRLSIYAKRFIIKSMQLVGATQGFIQRPFIIKGLIHGILAAMLAMIYLIGIFYITAKNIPDFIVMYNIENIIKIFIIMMFIGMILSAISSFFAVRKYLRMKHDKLYF
ncbi:MAG: cell division protein FtsX [Bacteroidetes bacterium GWE2_29_8]|nr:MAG: cell division protein FtsX [Bacteroidetes bacterium GWE2_29_8]OFY16481.1 MAG: cell division protein FtsX [Bacteroidetes bacterium GWF2_29_10]